MCPSVHSILSRSFKYFIHRQSFQLPCQLSQVCIQFLICQLYSSFSSVLVQSVWTSHLKDSNLRQFRRSDLSESVQIINIAMSKLGFVYDQFWTHTGSDVHQLHWLCLFAACAVSPMRIWWESVSPGARPSSLCTWCSSAPLCWVSEYRSDFRVLSWSGLLLAEWRKFFYPSALYRVPAHLLVVVCACKFGHTPTKTFQSVPVSGQFRHFLLTF